MFVSDILKIKGTDIVSITSDEPAAAAIALLCERHIGAVLVLDSHERILGILSERDLVRAMNTFREEVFAKRVSELMTQRVVTCSPQDPVAAIMGMMTAQRFRHVPVLEEGRLVGLISIGDVVKSRIEEAQAEVEALRQYITT
ncbi:MAG: CBS domain-containing protein [Rhodospirillales bacterium]|nr:MAG: CBS domain-containing protein [Rhodospirillales bacterium]